MLLLSTLANALTDGAESEIVAADFDDRSEPLQGGE
jgi:hypothetical protein